MIRDLILSPEYRDFERNLPERARLKLLYALNILETITPLSRKFVKKLTNTDFYELRITVDHEIRVILFAIDNDNINLASKVILLNGFIKKSTKDYNKEIQKATNILKNLL